MITLLSEATEAHSILEGRAGILLLLIIAALCICGALAVLLSLRRKRTRSALEKYREELRAEFERYKLRKDKEAAEAGQRRLEELVKEILPAIDNMDRALGAAQLPVLTSAESIIEGVQLVQQQLFAALKRLGIENFDPQGEHFDPRFHEAIQMVDTACSPPGTIVRVIQRGYMVGDRLLRPALVSVVRALAEAVRS